MAKISVDTAENEPLKISGWFNSFFHSLPYLSPSGLFRWCGFLDLSEARSRLYRRRLQLKFHRAAFFKIYTITSLQINLCTKGQTNQFGIAKIAGILSGSSLERDVRWKVSRFVDRGDTSSGFSARAGHLADGLAFMEFHRYMLPFDHNCAAFWFS